MSTTAIIAEFNPFHNGHKYLLDKVRTSADDRVIVIMSGNFTQRGVPAIADKYARAKCALLSGADLVLEMPALYATGSAYDFARGGVTLADKLNVCDTLAFGVEMNNNNSEDDNQSLINLDTFNKVADILTEEPDEYKLLLKENLSNGMSFPSAREKAVTDYISQNDPSYSPDDSSEMIKEILSLSNNILALEYIQTLNELKSDIKPLAIQRVGNNYNDASLTGEYSSATAIRNAIGEFCQSGVADKKEGSALSSTMPESSIDCINDFIQNGCITEDALTDWISHKLIEMRYEDINELADIMDSNEDIAHKILNLKAFDSYDSIVEGLKSKEITRSRISRVLVHLIMGITNEDRKKAYNEGTIQYANILGFRRDSSELISKINGVSELTLINKKSAFSPEANTAAARLWEIDRKATDIYSHICRSECGVIIPPELTSNIVIL